MNFTIINNNNISLIYDFLKTTSSKYFRYYNKRNPEEVIKNHLYTIIGTVEDIPVCYGHIDCCDNKNWLGLCVSDNKINQKYGTAILNNLLEWCNNNIYIVYLSVDVNNDIAINLYKKFGFIIHEYKNDIIFMNKITSKLNTIKLDTSFGESLDKLSILEIKLENIKDDRINDVKIEYDLLHKQTNHIFNNDINYFYYILKDINNNIWNLQDTYRLSNDINERNILCDNIIEENDRRFRVKLKINNYLNSTIKEQKGYIKKKAFILTHLGLGDMVNCIGMIRYLSTVYDELLVVCKKNYYNNIKLLFENDKSIKFYQCENDKDVSPNFGCDKDKFINIVNGYNNIFLCGMHKIYSFVPTENIIQNKYTHIIPYWFYDNCGLEPSVYRHYSFVPRLYESVKLYNEVKNICDKYIVLHDTSSIGNMFKLNEIVKNIDINETLVINIDKNIYEKGHKYYEIADKCIMKPILYYVDLIENSLMNILSDSCMFCLALQLNINTKHNYYIGRHEYHYLFDTNYGFNPDIHPLFILLKQVKTQNTN